jgi:hypothetical protein
MKFTPKKAPAPAKKAGKDFEPTSEIGRSLFLRSLISLPFRALDLKQLDEEGKDSNLGKEIVKLLKAYDLGELFDVNNENEMKNWDYNFGKFKKAVDYMKHEGFKQSAILFIEEQSE